MTLALQEDVPRCPACRADGAPREDWGCDRLANTSVWQATCRLCGGGDGDCVRCGGAGTIEIRRCPTSFIERHARGAPTALGGFMETWSAWRRWGVMPRSGGLLEQSTVWVQAVRVADTAAARIEDAAARKRERESQRQSRAAQLRAQQGG